MSATYRCMLQIYVQISKEQHIRQIDFSIKQRSERSCRFAEVLTNSNTFVIKIMYISFRHLRVKVRIRFADVLKISNLLMIQINDTSNSTLSNTREGSYMVCGSCSTSNLRMIKVTVTQICHFRKRDDIRISFVDFLQRRGSC